MFSTGSENCPGGKPALVSEWSSAPVRTALEIATTAIDDGRTQEERAAEPLQRQVVLRGPFQSSSHSLVPVLRSPQRDGRGGREDYDFGLGRHNDRPLEP